MPATLAKVKSARATCDSLVKKLCTDLPQGSRVCEMVTEKTKSFPSARCKELMEHYAEVLGELKQMEAQGGPQMPGMPPAGHGMPPGAMPPGAMPPAGHP
jgi:hypothetical protein